MLKVFSIALIVIHLFANTEIVQILKFPQLISHYFQHSRIDPSLNFFEFLTMHYGGDDGTHADDSEDMKLPYHNTNLNSFSFFAIVKPFFVSEDFKQKEKAVFVDYISSYIPSGYVLMILQPPRA
jgi:hypothetical protein